MVTELQELMRANVAAPHLTGWTSPASSRTAGRRCAAAASPYRRRGSRCRGCRGRRLRADRAGRGGTPSPHAPARSGRDRPCTLADAQPAVEGRDYDVLASHTNDNLDRDNGQYFDGVTNDGLVLPRRSAVRPALATVRADGPGDR